MSPKLAQLLAAATAGALVGQLVRQQAGTHKPRTAIDDRLIVALQLGARNLDRLVVLVDELNRNVRTHVERMAPRTFYFEDDESKARSNFHDIPGPPLTEKQARQSFRMGTQMVVDTHTDDTPSVGEGPAVRDAFRAAGQPDGGAA